MRATIGVLLTVCVYVWGAFGQTTQSQLECFENNVASLRSDCAILLGKVFSGSTTGQIDPMNLTNFCESKCAGVAYNFFIDRCNSAVIDSLCSMDNMSYCSVRSQEVNTMIGDIISGPCMNVDCTNPTCKDAVAKLTCCVNALESISGFFEDITNSLPSDCLKYAKTCGGAGISSMPLAVLMALMLFVVATS